MTRTRPMTAYATFVMFLWPVVARVAHNVPLSGKILCQSIGCDRERVSSDNCPPWHACNTHTALCRPCNRCNPKDADDDARYRNTSPPNCQHPTECLTSYDPHPSDMCPFLKVSAAYQCSGNCVPCQGTLGHFLGTVCHLNCAHGDSEILNCIFLNEIAQWNITRKPRWIDYERYDATTPRPTQLNEETSSNPAFPKGSTEITAAQLGALSPTSTLEPATTNIIIVVVAMAVVVVIVASGFAVIWRERRRRRGPKQPLTPNSSPPRPSPLPSPRPSLPPPPPPPTPPLPPPAPSPSMQPNDDDDDQQERRSLLDDGPRRRPVAVEHEEQAATDEVSDHRSPLVNHRQPTETSCQTSSIQETQQDQHNEQNMMDSAGHVVGNGEIINTAEEQLDISDPFSYLISLHSDYRNLNEF